MAQHAAAVDGAAEEEGDAGDAVVAAAGAVHRDRAAELGEEQDRRAIPDGAERFAQRLDALVEIVELEGEDALRRALALVRVPAADFHHRDARAVARDDDVRRHLGQRLEAIAACAAHRFRVLLHVAARFGDGADFLRALEG